MNKTAEQLMRIVANLSLAAYMLLNIAVHLLGITLTSEQEVAWTRAAIIALSVLVCQKQETGK